MGHMDINFKFRWDQMVVGYFWQCQHLCRRHKNIFVHAPARKRGYQNFLSRKG